MNVIQPRAPRHDLRLHAERYPEILLVANSVSEKSWSRYADEGIGIFVQPYGLADDRRVACQLAHQELVTDNSYRIRRLSSTILRRQHSTTKRSHAEHGKVITRYQVYQRIIGGHAGARGFYGAAMFFS